MKEPTVRNPFTPTFGSSPELLVGRDGILDSFTRGLDEGPGSPTRALLLSGQRGVGKTALLNAIEDRAQALGWLTMAETALEGLIDRLVTDHLPTLLRNHDPRSVTRHLDGVTAPGGIGGATFTVRDRHPGTPSLRSQLTDLTGILAPHRTGVLITVDEVWPGSAGELRELATVIQHLFREARPVAVVMAGLPENVDALLNAEAITFLRRAHHSILGAVTRAEARAALEVPVTAAGRRFDDDALDAAVDATRGYPYMIQLIGYHSFAVDGEGTITHDAVATARQKALGEVGRMVHRPALRLLSAKELEFVRAMAVDDGPSHTSDIAARMDRSPAYVGQYRRRLLAKHIISAPAYGLVDLPMPGMRDYLRLDPDATEAAYTGFW
ncbi:ATP-binding protein [Corynebacterium sp. P5875]|uniref:ATP-binding protein n=1 Tax=Corynebacterium antarcticum TaxID=2800405 RepID=A0A9Q4C9Z6_9CORY|nr:ATP-binding protein [Corynebacterium antarcticum]MCX7536946.1 ATP-binding protein [Corynebacterium antarcticum]